VVHKKYLKKKTILEWFKEGRKKGSGMSNFWRTLTTSLPIFIDWLAWKPVNEWDIRIGEDLMIGTQSYFKLSKNFTSTMHSIGIKFLAQVGFLVTEDQKSSRWKNAETVGIVGEQKEEWDLYVKGLVWSGFELNVENDTLMWSWNTKGGQVNTKQSYEVQTLDDNEVCQNE
jgi:hypothetical protein